MLAGRKVKKKNEIRVFSPIGPLPKRFNFVYHHWALKKVKGTTFKGFK